MSPALFTLVLLTAMYFVIFAKELPKPFKTILLYTSATLFLTALILALAEISRAG